MIRPLFLPYFAAGVATVFTVSGGVLQGAPTDGKVHFNHDIRPIMSDTCFHCHGPDKRARKGGLRLDIRDEALKPAKSGEIPIVPGKPEDSEIIKRIFTTDKDDLMPPDEAHKEFTPAQKEMFKRWVAEGAVYEPHWAYTPLVRPPLPAIRNPQFEIRNPIDPFILEKLEEIHSKPSPEADKATLLRRLSLDLIGLPPTPEEVRVFEQDASPQAYENEVDRLMRSPHFGERWAVWWLDVARFTDTVGFHGDQNQRIFPYRDYVINAFNGNKHFDQFTREQLAGDLLPHPTVEQRVATGFNRLNMVTREGGAQANEYLAKYGAERVRTIGTAWLGSTFGCAECHDHKFDPITQRDFYSMQAFFADVKQWGVYASYGSSPNPELKGFTNDYPFPPEIQVDSPYLERQETRVRGQLRGIAVEAMAKAGADPKAKAQFDAWKQEMTDFLLANGDGWLATEPEVVTIAATVPTKKASKKEKLAKADGATSANAAKPIAKAAKKPVAAPPGPPAITFKVRDDNSILVTGSQADDTTITLHPRAGWVGMLRLELLPDPSHKGSILRSGLANTEADLKLKASFQKRGAKQPASLGLRYEDANSKDVTYKDGDEIIGIMNQWKTSATAWNQAQAAYLVLDKPVRVEEGDAVSLRISGNSAGCFRVAVSPLAPPDLKDKGWVAALRKALVATDAGNREMVEEAYLLGTGWDAAALAHYAALYPKLLECRDGKAWTMVTEQAPPLTVRVLPRGNWMDQSGAVVQPATPGFLPTAYHPLEEKRATRLDLANWLCSKENPMTARAEMNRLWRQFFGNGISMVVDDLGTQGEPPSHPELLDWLGAEFRDSGWDFKHMVKTIVMSHTYRQSSRLRPELRDIDPTNRLLASQNPRRLDAEFVRDNALFISGLINLDIGGPSVMPYQPAGYYANLQFPNREYAPDNDDRQWRRGVYVHWQRTFLHPMLANFDAPMRDECTANRNVSNTPQQALTLLNDPTFVEAARVLAAKILAEKPASDAAALDRLYELALSRQPKAMEKPSLLAMLQDQRSVYHSASGDAEKLDHVGISPVCTAFDPAELAAWTTVSRVVLNLHETITRY